jgi:hypothetical protein
MNVAELIEILHRFPDDTRVIAAAYDGYGDPVVMQRVVCATVDYDDVGDDSADAVSFKALVIGGDDEVFEDQGPA